MDLQYLKELLAIFDTSSATDLMIEEDGCSVWYLLHVRRLQLAPELRRCGPVLILIESWPH